MAQWQVFFRPLGFGYPRWLDCDDAREAVYFSSCFGLPVRLIGGGAC